MPQRWPASPPVSAIFPGSWGRRLKALRGLISLLLELAKSPPAQQTVRKQTDEAEYLARFTMEEQDFAHEALEIGRASYRLRDNDNLSIGRLTARLREASAEATPATGSA